MSIRMPLCIHLIQPFSVYCSGLSETFAYMFYISLHHCIHITLIPSFSLDRLIFTTSLSHCSLVGFSVKCICIIRVECSMTPLFKVFAITPPLPFIGCIALSCLSLRSIQSSSNSSCKTQVFEFSL